MIKKQQKYAEVLLKTCLKVSNNQPLLIIAPSTSYEFVRILTETACEIGVKDIGYYITDDYLKHTLLQNVDFKDLKDHPLFNKSIYNEYAKKKAAFLMLYTEFPGLMEDIDPKLMAKVKLHASETSTYFDECRDKNELAWCIAMVPTVEWAKLVYPDEENPLEKTWNTIFEICSLNSKNPEEKLQKKIESNQQICKKLNELNIKELHYKNSLGTDLKIGLSKNAIWCTGASKLKNGKEVLFNYPSEEVFTSPDKFQVNGIVYSTMPLLTAGVIIKDFSLEFQDGKIINVQAKKNQELLEEVINSSKNANYLGEVALVPFDSPIRNQETLFYTTLLDENASCHLAYGSGFTECIKNGSEMTEEEKENAGLNTSKTHVDFMIGSEDLEITALTYNEEEIKIFEKGNYSKDILN